MTNNFFCPLLQLGLKPYHSVCIIGFNAPEWHISLIGAIMAGYNYDNNN